MKLEKDGQTVELNNPIHVAAFIAKGWREVEEKPKAAKPKAKK